MARLTCWAGLLKKACPWALSAGVGFHARPELLGTALLGIQWPEFVKFVKTLQRPPEGMMTKLGHSSHELAAPWTL